MSYNVTIINGAGTLPVENGQYNITAEINGYSGTTITPATLTVDDSQSTYSFTVAAEGTLNLLVTESGIEGGTPVVGATFARCDSQGNIYGEPVISDSTGTAVFNNVPYSGAGGPTIYYKQTATAPDHTFDDTLKSIFLVGQTQTVMVKNAPIATKTFALTDANYQNLPIDSGTLTLNA